MTARSSSHKNNFVVPGTGHDKGFKDFVHLLASQRQSYTARVLLESGGRLPVSRMLAPVILCPGLCTL